jgi:KDO2-lipid IV(A) lauroyltransferase
MARLVVGQSLRKYADRWTFVRQALWAFEGLLLGTLMGVLGLLSPDRASHLGRWLARRLGPRQDKSRIIRRNLALAFPEKTEAEREELLLGVWGSMGAITAEYTHLGRIGGSEADERLQIEVLGEIAPLLDPSKPAVFVSGHISNWELTAAAATRQGVLLSAVYTPPQNPWHERILRHYRQALNCRLLPRADSMRALIRELNEGRSIGLVMDQRVDSGTAIPFFGLPKLTTLIPARLALRYGCELVPVRTRRLNGANFKVTFYPPIRPDDESAGEVDKAMQMTRKLNLMFEAWIRDNPEEWFCTKRRWAKDAVPPPEGTSVGTGAGGAETRPGDVAGLS